MKYKRYPTKRKKNTPKQNKRRTRKPRFTKIRTIAAFLILIGFSYYTIHIVSGLPSLNQLDHPKPEYASKVYSSDGVVIGQFSVINRSRISIDELPSYLINALIASEDRKFYHHRGIDIDRIIKATVKNIISFRIREGASTITQQVARNLYLGHEQSFTRKIREAITAIQIERRFTKVEILELYFNLAYFGDSSYGVGAAADHYFNKNASDLTLNESALLIGILPNPTLFHPITHTERSKIRRNMVLNAMADMDFISSDVAYKASERPVVLTDQTTLANSDIAPHFVDHVRKELSDLSVEYGFDLFRDGLTIHTTLDSRMQRYANRAIEQHLKTYQNTFNRQWDWNTPQGRTILQSGLEREIRVHPDYRRATDDGEREIVRNNLLADDQFINRTKQRLQTVQAGFTAIDPTTGQIKAMVGGSDYRENRHGLNRVTQIRRQPGSAFKPFIYTVAIDNGYMPSYQLPNEPITITTPDGTLWQPANADGITGGNVSLREGLSNSINIVAVRTMMELAPANQVTEYAHRMGINSHLQPYESLSLGTSEVSPIEITTAYGVFATNGILASPYAITRVEDADGNTIITFESESKQVIKPETAYIMTDILRDVIETGTGRSAQAYINFPAAGKTGTTQEYADGWFIGYTPDLVAGVWVGFDDRRLNLRNDGMGARSALPIWSRFMKYTYEDNTLNYDPREFDMPMGVVRAAVCVESKMRATDHCLDSIDEVMFENHLPKECDEHTSFFRSVKNFITRIFN